MYEVSIDIFEKIRTIRRINFPDEVRKMKRNLTLKLTKLVLNVINSASFLNSSRTSERYFTRNRKLNFKNIMLFIIRGITKNIQSELRDFMIKALKQDESCSKQAFSKARQHIKYEAFRELVDYSVDLFYAEAKYTKFHNYRILAVDGSKLNLPDSHELRSEFGFQTTSGESQVQGTASLLYDVCNNLILDAHLDKCKSNERILAEKHLQWLAENTLDNELIIFDRGYPSAELINSVETKGFKYVMRCSTEFVKHIKYTGKDAIVSHKFKNRSIKHPIRFRIVEIEIDNTIEYLITNLANSEFDAEELKELYHMRWGIETKYDDLKNKLSIESFSGLTKIAILQDYYASLFLSNFTAYLIYDNKEDIQKANMCNSRKYEYKQNVNQTIACLKDFVIDTMAYGSIFKIRKMLKIVTKELEKAIIPVRKNRFFERIKKHKSNKFPTNMR